ncbi:uncharacterized protein LOC143255622 isoform X2 [Tachypleus tridentatus]|uniref:uncharacterized protein LOC143255622 isoform X2 n=1 Tax=Tachypleus tridentatus TaxID=6853 RepID=UPI003FD248D4
MIKSMKCLYNFVLFGIYIYLDILDESQGKVQFVLPLRSLRVYYEAPPGVHVTTLKAYDSEAPLTPVTFNMLEVRDYSLFHLDPTSGNLTTTRNIERTIGQMYHVMIAAVNQGEAEVIHIRISVTEFNRFPPEFEKELYHKELHVSSPANTSVLRVHAHDADPVDYNSEIYYYLGKEAPDGILELDTNTGQLTLIGNLNQSQRCLMFAVIAEDGGSPLRQARTRVEITIKTISEPLDIHTLNATDSLVYVCWSRPEFGDVSGYIIKYRKVGGEESGATIVNITTSASAKCITLKDLTPWTYYEFRLYGWNTNETGMRSNVNRFSTRHGYCSLDVCQNGECHMITDDPGYKCECADGYYGDICDQFDQCSSKPCENFGVCRRTSNESYNCECPSGFSGQNCTIFNPCAIQPCENGGTCESSASYTYTCRCAQGFYGNTCQNSDACSSGPCRNGGTCHNTSNGFSCDCTAGYEGEQCEIHISECKSNPCFNGARCEDEIYTFTCLCTPGYHGNLCQEAVQCPPSTEITAQGVFYWNKTDHGTYSVLDCPYGVSDSRKEGFVRRYCHLLSNGLVKWEITHVKNCREKDFYVAEQLTEELRSFTEDPTRINSEKLQEATKQIENIVGYAIYDKKTAQSMFSVISNVLAVNDSVLDEADDSENTTSRLLEVVDRYTAQVKLEQGQSVVLNAHNIALKVLSWSHELYLKAEEFLTFSPKYQSYDVKQETLSKIVNNLTVQSYENQEELLVTVPIGAVERVDKEYTGEVRVKLVIYKNDKFFRSRLAVHKSPYRSVFQASINTLQITNLTEPLVYLIPTPEEKRFICVYWNEKERTWVTNGLSTNQTGNLTICTSTHMTTFSILLDPIPTDQIHSDHQEALSIISYIGCVMSIFGLTLTILTYSLFRCLNRDRSGKILLNLCVSMLLMNIAFLIGSQQRSSVHVCVIVAIFIHYFLLTSLAWMCVEAINMYQMLIHVFASTETRFLLKRCLIAWGVPVLIVGATAGINFEVYGYENTLRPPTLASFSDNADEPWSPTHNKRFQLG